MRGFRGYLVQAQVRRESARRRDDIFPRVKELMEKDSAFAHFFEDFDKWAKKPAPGSNAFAKAKISREPPVGRTLVHPPLRRHR